MNHKTAPLTIISEIEAKDLINKSGEPFKLHKLRVKSASKGKEFEAILFSNGDQPIELGKEKTYSITEGTKGGWVIRELKEKKAWGGNAPKQNLPLEIQRIAFDAASKIVAQGDVAGMIKCADQIAKHLKTQL